MAEERSELIEEGERPIPSGTRELGYDRLLLLLLAIASIGIGMTVGVGVAVLYPPLMMLGVGIVAAGYLVGLGLIAIIARDMGAGLV